MSVSIDKVFRDVPKLIKRSSTKRKTLTDGMSEWIDYCEIQHPSRVWSRLRKLDYETDFDRLTLWLTQLLMKEPPGKEINGLWFGLYNPCDSDGNPTSQMYLAGSTRFDEPDWHCSPEYFPESRYANSEILPQIYQSCEKMKGDGGYLGEPVLCHGYLCLVLARWCRGPLRDLLLGSPRKRGIAFGHDSGDVFIVDHIGE